MRLACTTGKYLGLEQGDPAQCFISLRLLLARSLLSLPGYMGIVLEDSNGHFITLASASSCFSGNLGYSPFYPLGNLLKTPLKPETF